jgi:soluble lytic murein transglycosylase-like protein
LRSLLLCLAATLACALPAAGGPLHDPFVEAFLVGAYDDPDAVTVAGGVPAGLMEPAFADSTWLAEAAAVLASGEGAWARLLESWPGGAVRDAYRARLAAAVDALAQGRSAGPVARDEPFAAAQQTWRFFGALAAGDTATARAAAAALSASTDLDLHEGARAAWALRLSVLDGEAGWPGLEEILPGLGPWDTGNAWTMAVALRRAAGLPLLAGEKAETAALQVGGVARPWLEAEDIDAAPLNADLKAGLGAVVLPRRDLEAHFARYGSPPAGATLQGWWIRGQRRLAPGDAAHYEALAARADLAPVWQMDLWRRASERRLLAGQWTAGLQDLERALELSAQPAVARGPSTLVRDWTEQAFALALAQGRTGDAETILGLAERQARRVRDDRFRAGVRLMAAWQAGTAPVPEDNDLVERIRVAVRDGGAAEARPAETGDRRALLDASHSRPWALWRQWGMALTDVGDLAMDPDRQAAAAHYRALLGPAADEGALLAAAVDRLADREGVMPRLVSWALDRDVHRRTGGATPPLPSPVPELARQLSDSQADLHALLGAALALDDMRGTLAAASLLPGTGLTRDEKRRFLYPLPGPGPVLDALLAAGDEPALLLAIARNESLFEPAIRSRAGALGWMQIMPFHYPERGAVPGQDHWANPRTAIGRGAALVTENRRRYDGDPYRLLAAYNAGPGAVERWDRQLGEGADRRLFLAWIGYTETRGYVEKVLIDRAIYDRFLSEAVRGLRAPAKE